MKKTGLYSRITVAAFCAVLSVALLSGCVVISFDAINGGSLRGEGDLETFTYDVGEFTEISVDLLCEVEYYSAPSSSVTLTIFPNLREHVDVEVSGGVLSAKTNRNISWYDDAPVLTIKSPNLKKVAINGAGSFTAHDKLTADSFEFDLDGAIDAKADLDVSKLSVSVAGIVNLELSGSADKAVISADGTSKIDALSLRVRDASVSLAGLSTVSVNCSDNLFLEADGLGTVEYIGSPVIDMDTDGLVSIKKVG